MGDTTRDGRGRRPRSAVVAATGTLAALLLLAAPAAAQPDVVKAVSLINGAALDAGAVAEAVLGDDVSYAITVTGGSELASEEVTLEDVVTGTALRFSPDASAAGCTQDDQAQPSSIVCALTLDESGGGELLLAFTVAETPDASGCQAVTNSVSLFTGDGGVEGDAVATAETDLQVCPEGMTSAAAESPAASPPGTAEGTQGSSAGSGDDGQPNTAMAVGGASERAALILSGLLLTGLAAFLAVDLLARVPVEVRARRR